MLNLSPAHAKQVYCLYNLIVIDIVACWISMRIINVICSYSDFDKEIIYYE